MTSKQKYTAMRNAINDIDLALHGIDHLEEVQALFQDARDDLLIKVEMSMATFRQIAWGMHGGHLSSAWPIRLVMDIINKEKPAAYCWGKTKAGFPRHPLFVKTGTALETFDAD